MGMGGIPHRPGPGKPVRLNTDGREFPQCLQEGALEDLYRLPANIGSRRFSNISRTSAQIHVPLSGLRLLAGETATITVFSGPDDCLTFDHDLGYRETKTRFWPNSTKTSPAVAGQNTVELTGLDPGTRHFVRVLVESPRGRIWSFETDSFTTAP